MNITIQTQDRVFHTEEIIPLLTKYNMLSRFVCESIIDRAIESIELTPEEITEECWNLAKQNQLNTPTARQDWLARKCLNQAQFIELATRNLKIEKFKQAKWDNHEVGAYFFDHKQRLDQVVYSVIRLKDQGMANEIYFRVQAGEQSFSELVKQYSDGFEAQTGGLIGPVGIDSLPPPLAKRLLASQSGQLFMPFRWDKWFIVSRVEKIIPARLDLQMYQRLRNEFFHNWLQEQFQQHAYQIAHLEESFKSHEVVILNDHHLSLTSDRQNQKYAHHG
jgi:parvulin-like peptidyl-prolyl isomerase